MFWVNQPEYQFDPPSNNEESAKIEKVQQILELNTDIVHVKQLATDSEEISNRFANDDEGEKVPFFF